MSRALHHLRSTGIGIFATLLTAAPIARAESLLVDAAQIDGVIPAIHGITNDGEVITGVEVFARAYKAVGLGWMYAFTKVPALARAASALYDFWAERRLAVTGRPTMTEVMRARAAREAANGKTACAADAGR